MRIDLHTHSSVSDGTDRPAALVHRAHEAGLDVVAITDHDTAESWAEAERAAAEVGITLVRGMEISTRLGHASVHLLAYLPDPTYPPLARALADILDGRNDRVPAICAKLQALGVEVTEHDVRHQGRFDDTIGIFPEFIDGYGVLVLPVTGRYFQVPYRSLLPRGVRNLLVAGRATGGDRIAHAATRNMACCVVTGQGAGVAAALSLRAGTDLEDLDLAAVREELERQDVRIG